MQLSSEILLWVLNVFYCFLMQNASIHSLSYYLLQICLFFKQSNLSDLVNRIKNLVLVLKIVLD